MVLLWFVLGTRFTVPGFSEAEVVTGDDSKYNCCIFDPVANKKYGVSKRGKKYEEIDYGSQKSFFITPLAVRVRNAH